jgi:hypothetical protein
VFSGIETITCFNCGYIYQGNIIHDDEPPVEIYGVGVIHIEHGQHMPGQIYPCKDEGMKNKIIDWIRTNAIEQPIVQAYFTFFQNNSICQENLL